LFKLFTYSILFILGFLLIRNIDQLEILLFQKFPFFNLTSIFYTLRIAAGISLILLPLKLFSYVKSISFKVLLKIIFSISLFATPFVLSPPDSIEFKYKSTTEQQSSKLYSFLKNRKDIKTKNSLLCFLTAHCHFCQLAGKKIGVINKKLEVKNKIKIIINNDSIESKEFFTKIDLKSDFSFHKTSFDSLLEICGGSMPTIFLMKNDSIVNEYGSRSLNDTEIIKCLSEK
tara:strand:+ start:195 stop:884 length:690 start_codon:yes stop_codon:yes gene_type:complete